MAREYTEHIQAQLRMGKGKEREFSNQNLMLLKETGIKMTSKVLEKLLGDLRKHLTLETFRTFNQMVKEYQKILKKKLLKEDFSRMEPLVGKDVMKTESWALQNMVTSKTEFFTAQDCMKTRTLQSAATSTQVSQRAKELLKTRRI